MNLQLFDIEPVIRTQLLLFSAVINIILLVFVSRQRVEHNFSLRLFRAILVTLTVVSCLETLTWFTGEIGNSAMIGRHYWTNVLFLLGVPLPGSLGLMYLNYKVFGSISRRRIFVFILPSLTSFILLVINHFNRGIYFFIDDTNQYFRGTLLYANTVFLYVFVLVVIIYFFSQRRLITGKTTQSLLIFVLTPVLGAFLQTIAYGTTFVLPAYTLAAFMTFFLMERDELSRDPLTNLYTRANMESRLRHKLRAGDSFSLIMADLNDFKEINDTYGHLQGDIVLQQVSKILNQSVDYEDMVCRYGGDEFLILVENNNNIASKVIQRIERHLERFSTHINEYSIHMSFGSWFVDSKNSISLNDLLHSVDRKMYVDKQQKKQS